MSITSRGAVLSIDAMFAILVLFAIMVVGFWQLGHSAEKQKHEIKRIQLENDAIFLADSLVKNFDLNALLGIAVFDVEKKRVKSNEIMEKRIAELQKNPLIFGSWLKEKNGTQKTFFSKNTGKKECIAIERLVMSEKRRALFGVVVCE